MPIDLLQPRGQKRPQRGLLENQSSAEGLSLRPHFSRRRVLARGPTLGYSLGLLGPHPGLSWINKSTPLWQFTGTEIRGLQSSRGPFRSSRSRPLSLRRSDGLITAVDSPFCLWKPLASILTGRDMPNMTA